MAGVAHQLESQSGISRVNLFRTIVDYANLGTTYGCHESYLSRRSPLEFAQKVVDHLVSRIIYSGAGGFGKSKLRRCIFIITARFPPE